MADSNPYVDILNGSTALTPADATPMFPGVDDDNPYFDLLQPEPTRDGAGSFGRSFVRNVAPAVGGAVAAGAGAQAGAVVGGALGAPFGGVGAVPGAVLGAFLGGVAGGIGGSWATAEAQQYGLDALPDDWVDAIGQSREQQAKDAMLNPTETFLGGLVPNLLTMKVGGFAKGPKLPANATAYQRIVANPITGRLFGGAVMGGMELGSELATGQDLNWTNIAIATGFGVVFNKPNKIGQKLDHLGAAPIQNTHAGRLATERLGGFQPTVAEAGDAKVMGPGITEEVFMGTQRQADDSAMVAQQAARVEAAVLGKTPIGDGDVHGLARRIEPEVFSAYDTLSEQRSDLRAHLAAITDGAETGSPDALRARISQIDIAMRELSPQVSAAYRRASDFAGSEAVEPDLPPVVQPAEAPSQAPEAPSQTGEVPSEGVIAASAPIEQQLQFIADDVVRGLVAAGRPESEARAISALIAQRYKTRAGRLGNAMTPQRLYETEGAVIRRGKQRTPSATELAQRGKTLDQSGPLSVVDFEAIGPYQYDGQRITQNGEDIGNLKLRIEEGPTPHVVISDIELRGVMQGKGRGSEIIQSIAQIANDRGQVLALTSDAMRGKNAQKRQRALYERLGFVKNRGENKVKGITEEYVMPPKEELFQPAPPIDTPEFNAWFGKSAVVDESGAPLAVYHGTPKKFEAHDLKKSGKRTGDVSNAVFFTDNPKVAEGYRGKDWLRRGEVQEVYLKMENPRIVDFSDRSDRFAKAVESGDQAAMIDALMEQTMTRGLVIDGGKADGHDGLILKNIVDNKDTRDPTRSTVYVVFDPTQIKSTANRGTFDPTDPRILYQDTELEQTKRGSIVTPEGERPIIKLFAEADSSSFIHETGHQWLEELMRDAVHPQATDILKTDAGTVRKWLGVSDEVSAPGINRGGLTTKQHEKFARGFEQYMREGTAPSSALARVFAQFKSWLTDLYQTIRGLGEPINEDIRQVFDRMIEMEPQRTVVAPEREDVAGLSGIHETEATDVSPAQAEPVGDRIVAERDAYIAQQSPEVLNELAAAEQAAAAADGAPNAGAENPAGEGGRGAIPAAGAEPSAIPTSNAGGGERSPLNAIGAPGMGEGGGLPAGGAAATAGAAGDAGLRQQRSGAADVARAGQPLAPDPNTVFGPEQSPFLDAAGNIRVSNLTSEADVAQAIYEAAAENNNFIGDTQGQVTDGEVLDLANALGMTAESLNMRKIGEAFSAPQIMAARKLLIQSATDLSALAKRAANGTDADVMVYAEAKARHQMIQGQVAGITAEAGRALRAFRNIAGQEQAIGMDQFIKNATGTTLFQLKEEAKLAAVLDTPQLVSKFMNDARNIKFGSMVAEYWVNGLVSGPKTHITNIIGNTILSLTKAGPDTAVAALIGAARRAGGRKGETVKIGEVGAQFGGLARSLPVATKAAIQALRTGRSTLLPGEKGAEVLDVYQQEATPFAQAATLDETATVAEAVGELFGFGRGMLDGLTSVGKMLAAGGQKGEPMFGMRRSQLGAIPDFTVRGVNVLPVGTAVRIPTRLLAASDSFFRAVNYSMQKNALAYRAATEEGLAGSAFDARVADIRSNPSAEVMEQSRSEAAIQTLTARRSEFVKLLSRLANTPVIGLPIMKFFVPFINTPANIISEVVLHRTPIGIASPEIRADLMGKNGTVAQDTAMAKMLIGSSVAMGFGVLASQGLVSGSGPSDDSESALWRLAGNQAHSVRIGEFWYQVNQLGPMGMLASIAADLYDVGHAASEGDMERAASETIQAFTRNILDASFMMGPAELIEALEDPDRYGQRYVTGLVSSFVPFSGAMGQIARNVDPYSRQARETTDAIKAKVPLMSMELLPKIDIWGNPVLNRKALGSTLVTGVYMQQVSSDPVNIALQQAGYWPGAVSRKVRGVELTDEQYVIYAQTAGKMTKMQLDRIINSAQWQTFPPVVKHDVIQETVRQSRETARGYLMSKFPKIAADATALKLAPFRTGSE